MWVGDGKRLEEDVARRAGDPNDGLGEREEGLIRFLMRDHHGSPFEHGYFRFVVKAPIFAMLIAMAGCYRGMQVRDSSRELGRLTTLAVVQAIFSAILIDAVFALIYMKLNV